MQLYQSGFRPAKGYSQFDAEAEQAEQAATRQAQAMQQQRFQWEIDAKKDDKAKTSMYEFFSTQSNKYDPNNLLENMLTGNPEDVQSVRGFNNDKKIEAFEAYKRIAVNPDVNWFEGMWANSKVEEDRKIAMELINDYKIGKISEDEFNMAARDDSFQDWYRKSKLDKETAGALAGIYDPTYERFGEKFFGREDATGQAGENILARNPGATATVGIGAPVVGGAIAGGVALHKRKGTKLASTLDKAKALSAKYETLPEVKNKKTGNMNFDKSKAGNISKTQWLKNQADSRKAVVDAGKAIEKHKEGRLLRAGGKIVKGAGQVGAYAAPQIGRGIGGAAGGELGGDIGQTVGAGIYGGVVGAPAVKRLKDIGTKNMLKRRIAPKSFLKYLAKKAPKIAGKMGAMALADSPALPFGDLLALGYGFYELISLYNAWTKEQK